MSRTKDSPTAGTPTPTSSSTVAVGRFVKAPWQWRHQLGDHATRVRCSPDGAQLAAASLSGEVVILDAASGDVVAKLGEHPMGTLDLSWSPDGRRLAAAGQDGRAVVWDSTTHESLGEVQAKGWASIVRWSGDGGRLVASIGRRTAMLSSDGELIGWFGDQASTVTDVVWSPDDRRVGLLSYGGVRWFGTGRPKDTPDKIYGWKGSPLRGRISPSGKYLAHGNQDNSIHVWVLSSEGEMQMGGYPAKVDVLEWNRNGDYLAAGSVGGTTVWDCSGKGPSGRSALMCGGHSRRVTAVAWQKHGDVLVSGSADERLHWYRPASKGKKAGDVVGSFFVESEVSDLIFLPGDVSVAVALSDGTVGVVPLPLD